MKNSKRSYNNSISPTKNLPNGNPLKKTCTVISSVNSDSLNFSMDGQNLSDIFNNSAFDISTEQMSKENKLSEDQSTYLESNKWYRLRIKSVERDSRYFDLILELYEDKLPEKYILCRLKGPWCHTKLETNEIVSIQAVWNSQYNCYIIDKDLGFIVTNPDFLVSGTTVVGSLFCQRRAVLQDKFRGVDGDSKMMVVGSLVHQLLQNILSRKVVTEEDIKQIAKESLNSQNLMYMLYNSKMNLKEAEEEIQKFLPNIFKFINRYMLGKQTEVDKENFQGTIDTIKDIEENLWVPQLGLKGKVDVSVKIHNRNKITTKFMPLELKTGRASFSLEHKGQIILYQMMLNEIGQKVDSGLLLYLRESIMKEVPATRNEKRDLIILRNDLSHFLTRSMVNQHETHNELFKTLKLPDPINHHNACSKCPYVTICSSFLSTDDSTVLEETNPLNAISVVATDHLTRKDLDYFIYWCGILSLEQEEIKKSNVTNSLWTDTPIDRRNRGRAIINLKIINEIKFITGRYIHTFSINDEIEFTQTERKLDFTFSGFSVGEYVIVSTMKRIAIAAGHVYDLTKHSITLNLERNLLENYSKDNFIIDKHESQSQDIFNYTNLGILLDNTEHINQLRKIAVEKMPPTFTNLLPSIIARQGKKILENLNIIQRKAALNAISTNQYMLIKGLPGTGKTQTLIAIIRLLHLTNKTIIITSHTHSAIDNLLLRLKNENIRFLRLGSEIRIHPNLIEFSESKIIGNCTNPDDLAKIYGSYSIVAVTCLGCNHSIFTHRRNFDFCIVDEATQVFQPTVFRPLLFAKKFILVGDPDQLPPLVRSKKAKNLRGDESLFDRLDSTEATTILNLQYRMNKTITKLANDLTYNGKLQCANSEVMQACLKLPKKENLLKSKKWIIRVLEQHIDLSVFLLDTTNCLEKSIQFSDSFKSNSSKALENQEKNSELTSKLKFRYTNYCEAGIVFTLIKHLILAGFECSKIGIIASYRGQVDLLRKLLENFEEFYKKTEFNFDGLEINTVDQYQGRDKEIIIYSCTKTGNETQDNLGKENEILEDKRRLTVAITRAKHKLILIGDEKCLLRYTPFKNMFSKIPGRCKLVLEDGKLGFVWNDVLKELEIVMKDNSI